MSPRVLRMYPALEVQSFRFFFMGQVISFAGTWLQIAAQSWLVYQMTKSTIPIGIMMSMYFIPTSILAPFGGTIVDRFDIKRVLYATQLLGMSQALLFGMLVLTNHLSLGAIYTLVFALGIINALDVPARHTYVAWIVGKELLGSAMAMNETLMSLGLLLGPSFVGIFIAELGIPSLFFVNGLSYLGVIATLLLINVDVLHSAHNKSSGPMFLSGVRYVFSHAKIRMLIFLVGAVMAFGFPYRSLLPAVAEAKYYNNPWAFGLLFASPGIGSLIGAMIVSRSTRKLSPSLFIVGGIFSLGASIVAFSSTSNLVFGVTELAITGFGLTLVLSTVPTILRNFAEREMLGRVIGVEVMFFYGGLALGNLGFGYFAHEFGLERAISCSGSALLFLGFLLLASRRLAKLS